MERTYELAEHVKNDGHCRNRGEGGEEFGIADVHATGEGESLQGEKCRQVSCHDIEDEDKPTRPSDERYKTEESIVPLSDFP